MFFLPGGLPLGEQKKYVFILYVLDVILTHILDVILMQRLDVLVQMHILDASLLLLATMVIAHWCWGISLLYNAV